MKNILLILVGVLLYTTVGPLFLSNGPTTVQAGNTIPKYDGQIAVFLQHAEYSQDAITDILSLERVADVNCVTGIIVSAQYLWVSEDYLRAALLDFNSSNCSTVKVLYDFSDMKR